MIKKICLLILILFIVSAANASKWDFVVPDAINDERFEGGPPAYGHRIPAGGGIATINMELGPKTVNYPAPGAEGATPNIATNAADNARYWISGYGDLIDVIWPRKSGAQWQYLYNLIPDAGYQVKFHTG